MSQHGSETVKQLLIQQLPVNVVFPDRTETSKVLTLALSLRTTITPLKTSVSTLELEITDERDPFFLFLLHLPESDYGSLKSELSLTVDFAGFPDKFVQLIKLCDQTHESGAVYAGGRYSMELNARNTPHTLVIYEENQLRRLSQLVLRVQAATDVQLKEHLAESCAALERRAFAAEQQAAAAREALETERQRREREVTQLMRQHTEETDRHREDVQERDRQAVARISVLESRIAELQTELRLASESRAKTETQLTETTRSLHAASDEILHLRSEVTELRQQLGTSRFEGEKSIGAAGQQIASLQLQLSDRDKSLASAAQQIAALQAQLSGKEELLSRTQSLVDAANEQKTGLEQALQLVKTQKSDLEARVRALVDEVHKGNDVIARLQSKNRVTKEALAKRVEALRDRDNLIKTRDAELMQTRLEVSEVRSQLGIAQAEARSARAAQEKTERELRDMADELEKQKNAVMFLQKQQLEAQKPPQPRAGFAATGSAFRPSQPLVPLPAGAATTPPRYVHPAAGSTAPTGYAGADRSPTAGALALVQLGYQHHLPPAAAAAFLPHGENSSPSAGTPQRTFATAPAAATSTTAPAAASQSSSNAFDTAAVTATLGLSVGGGGGSSSGSGLPPSGRVQYRPRGDVSAMTASARV